jgi:hypothetical protein
MKRRGEEEGWFCVGEEEDGVKESRENRTTTIDRAQDRHTIGVLIALCRSISIYLLI